VRASLAGTDINEKPRVIAVALLTMVLAAVTSLAMDALGLAWVWTAILRLPFWTGLAAAIALWGGIMLVLMNAPRAAVFLARLLWRCAPACVSALVRIIVLAGRAVAGGAAAAASFAMRVLGAIARMLEPFYIALLMMAEPLLAALAPIIAPLREAWRRTALPAAGLARRLWRAVGPPLFARAASAWDRASYEWTLWRAYRREFRGRFGSYREFKGAFEAKERADARQQSPPPAPDPFAAACKALGLPADGNFSEREFKARYRALMKEVHPDIAGPNERAARVTAASVTIKKRKGWS
jgi:hypothetical protein